METKQLLVAVGPFSVALGLAVGSLLSKVLAALCAVRSPPGFTLLRGALLAAAHRNGH
jgi:hypothetical protein